MLSIIKLRFLRLRDEYLIIVIMTAMALGLTAIFGTSGLSIYRPTVLIINEDSSSYSEMFIEEMERDSTFKFEMSGYDEAAEIVDEGKALTAVLIDSDFGESIDRGDTPNIGILKVTDDRYIFTLERLISSISNRMLTNVRIAEITVGYLENFTDINREKTLMSIYDIAEESWRYRRPITVNREMINVDGNGGYDHLKHTMVGFSIFFSTYTLVFSIGTILSDRQYNTWQRILISPVSKASLLGGSMIASYIIGVFQVGILILGGRYLFNVDWGSSILGVILIAAAFVFTMTCFGLLLSSIVKTYSQLATVTPIVLISTAMLGGCLWPLEIINSRVLLTLANLTPHKWAVEGIKDIAMYGSGFEAAITPTLVLAGMGILFFGIGIKMLRFE